VTLSVKGRDECHSFHVIGCETRMRIKEILFFLNYEAKFEVEVLWVV